MSRDIGRATIKTSGNHRGAKRVTKPRQFALKEVNSHLKKRTRAWKAARVWGETVCKGNLAMILSSETQTVTLPSLEEVEEQDSDLDSDWSVVLLDDNHHTYDYVIEMLGDVFGYDELQAYGFAIEVDMKKRVTVWTGARERAEAYQEKIHDYGADWRMDISQGSMTAILEPAR